MRHASTLSYSSEQDSSRILAQHVAERHSKSLSNLFHIVYSDVPLRTLNGTDVIAVQLGLRRKFLLRPAALLAQQQHSGSEALPGTETGDRHDAHYVR